MPKHPLFESPKPGTSIPTKTPAPQASRAFPANVEPRGAVRTGPPPRAERATQSNIFNVDRHGKRKAMVLPRRVR